MATKLCVSTKQMFLDALECSKILRPAVFAQAVALTQSNTQSAEDAAKLICQAGLLTPFQARLLLVGKTDKLRVGAYIIQDQFKACPAGAWHRALHERLCRQAFLHILDSQYCFAEAALARFVREAQSAATLNHPQVMPMLDCGDIGKQLYFVTDFFNGSSLADCLNSGRVFSLHQTANLLHQVALALEYAHERGVCHGSLTPETILINCKQDRIQVKVCEFGMTSLNLLYARLDPARIEDYRAPELSGPLQVSPATDRYALGCIGYRLVTGFLPYEGFDSDNKALAHKLDPVPSAVRIRPSIPPALSNLLKSLMAKDPLNRPQSTSEVAARLAACIPDQTAGDDAEALNLSDFAPPDTGRSHQFSSRNDVYSRLSSYKPSAVPHIRFSTPKAMKPSLPPKQTNGSSDRTASTSSLATKSDIRAYRPETDSAGELSNSDTDLLSTQPTIPWVLILALTVLFASIMFVIFLILNR